MIAGGRGAVRAVPLGPLRPAGAAAQLPVRRHGESAADVRHADHARGRQEPGLAGGARTGALLVGQPGHQRHLERLLAERGLHRLRRAAHPGEALRPRARGHGGGARPPRTGRGDGRTAPEPTASCTSTSTGRDPDDGCTLVPYEKGALLLRTIEKAVGRERFDAFLRGYFDHFAFRSITTARIPGVHTARAAQPGAAGRVDLPARDSRRRRRAALGRRSPRSKTAGRQIPAAGPRTSGCISCARRSRPTWRASIANSTLPSPAIPRSSHSGC